MSECVERHDSAQQHAAAYYCSSRRGSCLALSEHYYPCQPLHSLIRHGIFPCLILLRLYVHLPGASLCCSSQPAQTPTTLRTRKHCQPPSITLTHTPYTPNPPNNPNHPCAHRRQEVPDWLRAVHVRLGRVDRRVLHTPRQQLGAVAAAVRTQGAMRAA